MTKTPDQHTDPDTALKKDSQTVDADEVAFFAAISDSWWDPNGPFKPLHKLNPTRLHYIRDNIVSHFGIDQSSDTPLHGLKILDIGCGGGLICEPLSRLGGTVTGVDASQKNIKVASHHANQSGVTVHYEHNTAEKLAKAGKHFDVIINMEVIEHVADIGAYLSACRQLLKPGGLMLVSTLNRTMKSYLFAIIGAEYVLRWLPRGAHDWHKFVTPHEMKNHLSTAGLQPGPATGYVFSPFNGKWRTSATDLGVNYAMTATTDT